MINRLQDYDRLGHIDFNQSRPIIIESYSGADIVQWWGTILRQLQDMKNRAEESSNDEYATLLSRFIRTWQENELTGSINVEDVNALKTAAEWASSLPWNFANYFSVLTNWLRRLKASIEQLPTMSPDQGQKGAGGPGAMPTASLDPSKDPAAPQFGPEENEGDMEGGVEDKMNKEGDEETIANDIKAAMDATKAQRG